MQSKARVLSELVATRNIIKSKFKRTYLDRMKRERIMKELLKPVTSAITTLKPATDTKNKKKIFSSSSSADTHTSKDKSKNTSSILGEDDYNLKPARSLAGFSTNGSDSSQKYMKTKIPKFFTPATTLKSTQQFSLLPIPTPTVSSTPKAKPNKYTYEVEHDNQDLKNYDKPPPDDVVVTVTRTNRTTGEMTPSRMQWRDIPQTSKDQWMRKRARLFDFMKTPGVSKILEKDSRRIESMTKSPVLTSDHTSENEESPSTSKKTRRFRKKKGKGIKTYNDSIDFNFIPYNINNRIIYEYFDDPNELCDRLRLLVSSRMAGNTNHMQEINSIVEELRELDCIV